jgi:hypothetical protein
MGEGRHTGHDSTLVESALEQIPLDVDQALYPACLK